jgi:hypothetical protein
LEAIRNDWDVPDFAIIFDPGYHTKVPPAPGGAVLFLMGLGLAIVVIWVLMSWKK